MCIDPQCDDAARIIRGLTTLPGGVSVEVLATKFPRLGPAEPGTGYQQEKQSFELDRLPDRLPIPSGMDEIVIMMQGAMAGADASLKLLAQVNDLLGSVQTNMCWESRTYFGNVQETPRSYKVELFRSFAEPGDA